MIYAKRLSLFKYMLTTIIGLTGCSFLATKPSGQSAAQNASKDKGFKFKQRVSPTANLVTTPVDIATEFNSLIKDSYVEKVKKNPLKTKKLTLQDKDTEEGAIVADVHTLKNEPPKSLRGYKANRGKHKDAGSRRIASDILKLPNSSSYAVKPGDTLMMISFLKYGNVYRWREIYNINKEVIENYNLLTPGTILRMDGEEFAVIVKNGKPYLIRRNDTLVKISKYLYNTPAKWRNLWQNNTQLIKNPNKIYAGFTLYYQ